MKQRESTITVHRSCIKRKNNNGDLIDRFSDLPTSILAVILSFLSTKNAVATSVLSKRWKHVWVTVPSLNFRHKGRFYTQNVGKDKRFIRFVKRVLLLHDVGSINKFRLAWNPRSISYFDAYSWIVYAITRNVQMLFLSVGTPFGPYNLPGLFEMPVCVLTCDSLQSLELNGGIFFSDTIEVCLTRLVSLKLDSIVFEFEDAFKKLISGCLMLKYLNIYVDIDEMIHSFQKDYDFMFTISSTSLRHLELIFQYQVPLHGEIVGCGLKLEAYSLEYLKVEGYISAISIEKSLNSLVEVDFGIQLLAFDFPEEEFQFLEPDFPGKAFCNSFVVAVRAFSCAKVLTFSAGAMRALSNGTISLSTEFRRLVKLETSIECFDCSPLRDLIQSSDNLEILTIHQCPNHGHEHDTSNWVDLPHLKCVSNSLKTVVLNVIWMMNVR